MPICKARKDDGTRCRNKALESGYCRVHEPVAQEGSSLAHDATPASKRLEFEASALVEDYKLMSTHISEFATLQYQLVGLAYAIVGAALTLWGNSGTQPPGFLILFFPPVFCAIVLVETYLHANIKAYSRYIDFRLRPRMEAIINGEACRTERLKVWTWGEYYVTSYGVARYFVRVLGSIVVVLPLIPAIGALLIYWLLLPPVASSAEQFVAIAAAAGVLLTFLAAVVIIWLNERWWRREKKELDSGKSDAVGTGEVPTPGSAVLSQSLVRKR